MSNQSKYAVTYHLNLMGGKVPVIVLCENENEQMDVAHDADSLHGICNVRLNTCGKYRKGAIKINATRHYKCEFHEIEREYLNQYFKTN